MPSIAYKTYKTNRKQVERLLEAYYTLLEQNNGRGKKALDHLTRSAIIFLCSSWEVYIEQVIEESVKIMSTKNESVGQLPLVVQKTLSKHVKDSRNDLEPIIFIETGWKQYYVLRTKEQMRSLNTPKKLNIIDLFNSLLGVQKDMLNASIPDLIQVNDIVIIRGKIAHNVFAEDYVKSELVEEYLKTINLLVQKIDIFLWDYLPGVTDNKRPWQNTYR